MFNPCSTCDSNSACILVFNQAVEWKFWKVVIVVSIAIRRGGARDWFMDVSNNDKILASGIWAGLLFSCYYVGFVVDN